nr:unnamed protein product [Callosobruchus analis]
MLELYGLYKQATVGDVNIGTLIAYLSVTSSLKVVYI